MPLTSFFGLVTLQVGLAIITAVFYTVAFLSAAVNTFDFYNHPKNDFPIPVVLIAIFVIFMIVSGIIMFVAAYQESRQLCMIAVACIVLVTTYWIILCCFSFANQPVYLRRVCVYDRCGESFWIANLKYKIVIDTNQTKKTVLTPARQKKFTPNINLNDVLNSSVYWSINKRQTINDDSYDQRNQRPDYFRQNEDLEEDEGRSQYIFGLQMIGAIFLFVINFLFFMFTILILWSYAQELKWADYYYDPETTHVVDKS